MTTQPPAPTVTGFADASPCPRVEVLISPMPADAATVSVWRNYGGVIERVRGAVNAPVAGDFLVVDYEAPFGSPVTYTAQTADLSGTGSPLSDPSTSLTLDVADVWLSDPLAPATSMALPLVQGTGDVSVKVGSFAGSYEQDASLVTPVGGVLPVAVVGARRAVSAMPLTVATFSAAAEHQLLDILLQAAITCLRVPVAVRRVPPVTYQQIGGVTPADDPSLERTVWPLVCTSVQPPGLNVIIPTRTYDDVPAEAATYDDLSLLYATYIDLQRG